MLPEAWAPCRVCAHHALGVISPMPVYVIGSNAQSLGEGYKTYLRFVSFWCMLDQIAAISALGPLWQKGEDCISSPVSLSRWVMARVENFSTWTMKMYYHQCNFSANIKLAKSLKLSLKGRLAQKNRTHFLHKYISIGSWRSFDIWDYVCIIMRSVDCCSEMNNILTFILIGRCYCHLPVANILIVIIFYTEFWVLLKNIKKPLR